MGSLFSGSTKTKSTSEPWKPQADALRNIFSNAGSIYERSAGTPFYQGPLYAGMDQTTADGISQVADHVNTAGAAGAGSISAAGGNMLSRWGASPNAIDSLMMQATTDPTAANIAAATQYANNPATDGMIDAASRDVVRNLRENEITGINRGASASGNINSTRAGVAQAVAERGAADRVADISSAIRGEQFDRGLSLAENARQANMGQTGNVAQLNNQTFGLGIDGITTGNNLQLQNLDAMIRAGNMRQEDAQGQIDADFARWQGADTRDTDLLARYYGIVGANNWGGTQTTRQRTSPSIFGTVMGLGSLASGFGLFGGGK